MRGVQATHDSLCGNVAPATAVLRRRGPGLLLTSACTGVWHAARRECTQRRGASRPCSTTACQWRGSGQRPCSAALAAAAAAAASAAGAGGALRLRRGRQEPGGRAVGGGCSSGLWPAAGGSLEVKLSWRVADLNCSSCCPGTCKGSTLPTPRSVSRDLSGWHLLCAGAMAIRRSICRSCCGRRGWFGATPRRRRCCRRRRCSSTPRRPRWPLIQLCGVN